MHKIPIYVPERSVEENVALDLSIIACAGAKYFLVEATIRQLTRRMPMTTIFFFIDTHKYMFSQIRKGLIGLDFQPSHLGGTRLVLPSGGPMNNSVSTSEFSLLSVDS